MQLDRACKRVVDCGMNTIGNNYGAALTAEDIVATFSGETAFRAALASSSPNLAMRMFLSARGFDRVARSFADNVISLATR